MLLMKLVAKFTLAVVLVQSCNALSYRASLKSRFASKNCNNFAMQASVENYADLMEYAQNELGVAINNINVANINNVRGVSAIGKIREKQEFITIPSKNCLITTTDQACPFPEWVNRNEWKTSPWYVRLALLLLFEDGKGEASVLFPWILRLPKDIPIPLYWSAENLIELKYSSLINSVQKQKKEWEDIYVRLEKNNPGLNGLSKERLFWAMSISYSRAFSGPYEGRGPNGRISEVIFLSILVAGYLYAGLGTLDQVANGAMAVLVSIPMRDFFMSKMAGLKRYALTPIIDFANHSGKETGEVAYNYFYDSFCAISGREFESGEEVLLSYGKRSNDHLLQFYGFVEEGNMHDVYVVENFVPKVINVLGQTIDSSRLDILEKSNLVTDNMAITYCYSGLLSAKSDPIMPILRLLALSDSQLDEKKIENISLKDFKSQLSPANEKAAWSLAVTVAENELESLQLFSSEKYTSVDDRELPISEHRRLAILFRAEKIKTLEKAIHSLKEAISNSAI